MVESGEKQILRQYIRNHKDPKDEFEKGFICALNELNKAFKLIKD